MTSVVVVTGTDTEIGKTFVTAGLARHLTARGHRVVAVKPVESGTRGDNAHEREDGVVLARATGQTTPRAALQRLTAPVAPPVAADVENILLDPEGWCNTITGLAKGVDLVLVEGAGGLFSPLAHGWTALDLARRLQARVLVVGADRLGTLNHTRLTLAALETAGVGVLGVVLSAPASADASTGRNRDVLARGGQKVTDVPRGAGMDHDCWGQIAAWIGAASTAAPAVPLEGPSGWANAAVEKRRNQGLLRTTAVLPPGCRNFSGNDYLGLSQHPAVVAAAREALDKYGLGPRGSPLICGYTQAHEALEATLAAHCGTESALLFPTGYAANVATLTSLASGADCAIFSDSLNHASIIDGCRLAARGGAQLHIYRHLDVTHLEALLTSCQRPRRVIVTESVFSMDGDCAPLTTLRRLADAHGAWLVCDEAHATLLFDPHPGIDVHVGTLSKAVGAQGGFVASAKPVREWLLNAGRPYVFSTALPIPIVAAANASFRVASQEPGLRARVLSHAQKVRASVLRSGLVRTGDLPDTITPIIPIILGDEEQTMAASLALCDAGFHIPGIRPPTVPEGTSRLRVTVSAAHTDEDIDALLLQIDEHGRAGL
jgi:8-amino-7-oxononanoate synthase